MSNFTSILVVTDFSSGSDSAVLRAAGLAAEQEARLVLLTVVDPSATGGLHPWLPSRVDVETKISRASGHLDRLAAKVSAGHGVRVDRIVVAGDPLDEVRRHAHECDLVVLGVKRSNPLRDLVFGAPAERLMRLARRCVLVVKKPARAAYRRVVVPVDFTACAEAIVRSAVRSAPQAALHLCHASSTARETRLRAADVPEAVVRTWRDRASAKALERLNSLILAVGHRRATSCVGHGDPSQLALEMQAAVEADLIAVGKDEQPAIGEFLFSSVARRLVADAPCDVLVIPRAALPGHQVLTRLAKDGPLIDSPRAWAHRSWLDVDERGGEVAT
jgi:nucleotide-binding universal stress UspA family protein